MLTCESAYTRATCSAVSLAYASGNLMFGAMMLPWPTTWKAAALPGKFFLHSLSPPSLSLCAVSQHTRRHNGNLNESARVLQLNASLSPPPSPPAAEGQVDCAAHSAVIRSSARQTEANFSTYQRLLLLLYISSNFQQIFRNLYSFNTPSISSIT